MEVSKDDPFCAALTLVVDLIQLTTEEKLIHDGSKTSFMLAIRPAHQN